MIKSVPCRIEMTRYKNYLDTSTNFKNTVEQLPPLNIRIWFKTSYKITGNVVCKMQRV